MRWSLVLLCLMPWAAEAGTIYLCKSYGGGTFWSSAHCHQHNSLIDRTVTVPDSLPWEQKVQLGEQARAEAAKLTAPAPQVTVRQSQQSQQSNHSQCSSLAARAAQLDAMARQPQPGSTQDRITAEKRTVRDQQYRLRC